MYFIKVKLKEIEMFSLTNNKFIIIKRQDIDVHVKMRK